MKKFLFLIGILITLSASAQQTNDMFVGYNFGIPLVAAKPAVPTTDKYKMRMWYDSSLSTSTRQVLYIYNPKVSIRSVDIVYINSNVNTTKSINITTSAYTVASDISVVFINYTGGQALITLPNAANYLDREITIRNLNFSQQVNIANEDNSGLNAYILAGEGATLHSDGTVWQTVSTVKF